MQSRVHGPLAKDGLHDEHGIIAGQGPADTLDGHGDVSLECRRHECAPPSR
jgi:hypothetical protein